MKIPENRISSTFYLLLTTLAALTLCGYLIPQQFFSTYHIRKVDYITPLVMEKEKPLRSETRQVTKRKAIKKVPTRPVPGGLITLEDYSRNGTQLRSFLEALYCRKSSTGNVRIAFYGDSFIEGDILTMDLRDSLQHRFGGQGIGFLPVSSETSMFRKSLPSESSGWKVYSLAGKSPREALGMAGTVYVPGNNARVKLFSPKPLTGIQLIYQNQGPEVIIRSRAGQVAAEDTLASSGTITLHTLSADKDQLHNCELNVIGHEQLKVYGLNIADGKGLYLDNFSIRGNSGLGLRDIPDSQYVAFQKLMNYKLIVLQFGLNATLATTTDFSNYEKHMVKMINHLKELFPGTSFLLLSTSDRSYRLNGSFVTMPSIPLLVEAQRRIASTAGILFWNMYEAMGGENSMVALVKDRKANKDYTHLNFAGGQLLADKLFKALMYEYRNYENDQESDKIRLAVR